MPAGSRPIARAAAIASAATAALAPVAARADEPVRPEVYDPGEYPPGVTRGSLLIVGAAVTAAWYGAAAGTSYLFPEAPGAEALRIPVAGPWMALADAGCGDDPDCETFDVVLRVILTTLDGVGQAGGVLAMAEAPFLPTARAAPRNPHPALTVRPAPAATRSGLGLGVVGSF